MYIVELRKGVWLADWDGDPPRTLDIENAKQFKSERGAKISLSRSRKYRRFKKSRVVELNK